MRKTLLETQANFQVASLGGFGQIELEFGGTASSPTDQEFVSAYAHVASVINYSSAAFDNKGTASFTGVAIPAGSYFIAHMKDVTVTTGKVTLNCLTVDPA